MVIDSSRRSFLKTAAMAGLLSAKTARAAEESQTVQTPVLNVGYEESGNPNGFPIVLLHGFPDDVRAWDGVVPPLVQAGHRVLVPYLRGYGPTRFRDPAAPRKAEQAAMGQDVIDFANALALPTFAVAGFDWGGRAASVAAALHPERIKAAVICGGYLIQNTVNTTAAPPAPPAVERELWYQSYFNLERGRAGLKANRKAICKFLWQTWSPDWRFTDEVYDRTAGSFENPDFVDIVIHSYRHRIGNAPGEERFLRVEQQLAKRPKITVPAIVLHGANDPLARPPADSPAERAQFPALVGRRVFPGVGHFLPREKPDAVSTAILELLASR